MGARPQLTSKSGAVRRLPQSPESGAAQVLTDQCPCSSTLTDVKMGVEVPSSAKKGNVTPQEKDDIWWALFVFWNVVLSFLALGLLAGAEFQAKYRIPLLGLGASILFLAVLTTHGVGGHWRHGTRGWRFWQPFHGGAAFVLTQALAWSFFGLTLLPSAAPLLMFSIAAARRECMGRGGNQWVNHSDSERADMELFWPPGLLLAAGVCGFLSETLVAASLWLFSSSNIPSKIAKTCLGSSFAPPLDSEYSTELQEDAANIFESPTQTELDYPLSNVRQLITYDKGHGEVQDANRDHHSHIASSLAIDDISEVPVPQPLLSPVEKMTYNKCAKGHPSATVEPPHWSSRQKQTALFGPWNLPEASLSDYLWWIGVRAQSLALLSVIYCNHIFSISLCLSLFMTLPTSWAIAVIFAFAIPYGVTFQGRPERTGRRTWRALQGPFSRWLEEASLLHFRGVRIVRESEQPLPPSKKYIFGFHPHGLFPSFIAWIHLTSAWRNLFPEVHPVGLAASVVFRVPFLRDLNMWAGMREVSKNVFENALAEKKSVILCPGGQSELAYHMQQQEGIVTLCARHKGFIRMAMRTGASLVPIFSFGESKLFDNLLHWPALQRYTYKRFGFPVPFLPFGFLGFLPLPRAKAVTLVVGEPIAPAFTTPNPTEEEVDALRDDYFKAVHVLYNTHRAQFGYEDVELTFKF